MKILIVDDDANLRRLLKIELSDAGFSSSSAESGLKALDMLERENFDVMLLDLHMPGLDGMEVLKKIRTLEIPTEVIILTAYATVSTAVEAMKHGAYDYLTKPFKFEELKVIVQKALERRKLVRENILLKSQIKRQTQSHTIVTRDPRMIEILERARKFAVSDFSILITGESGVGKELVAHAVHEASARADGPFLPLNCGSIPENMLESELFGHEKGAFTGALSRKLGLLEIANNGVLFLDEIGEMPLPLQVKLLRVIETGRFFRVGGVKEVQVDVKFVAATNKNIEEEMKNNAFRPDLYYRISSLKLPVPPLRERQEDIPLLIEHFNQDSALYRNKRFSEVALDALCRYAWPGNVRELQNVVHSVLLLAKRDVIELKDLPEYLREEKNGGSGKLEDFEKAHILRVFRDTGGHRAKAAEILGIDQKTLYRKLQKYGVSK